MKNTGTIPIHPYRTGSVFIRNFDEGIMRLIGGVPDQTDPNDKCYKMPYSGGKVSVYFGNPEAAFRKKVYPFILINREMSLALERWMGVGQLEYRQALGNPFTIPQGTAIGPDGMYPILTSDVSGHLGYEMKPQAWPYNFTYTIQVFDKYEKTVQVILRDLLKRIHPVGKVIVYDDLNLMRSYEYLQEGSLASIQEQVDPATRARGYELTIVVQGEMDQSDPYTTNAVTGFDLSLGVM